MTSKLLVRKVRAGFTLIELLVVIAIIAILAAILFPVAGTVQESARRSATMSNLQKIHQAISAYELDNREYPEFLFGPAISKNDGTPYGGAPYYTMKETASLVTGRYRTLDAEYPASRIARLPTTRTDGHAETGIAPRPARLAVRRVEHEDASRHGVARRRGSTYSR